MTKLQVNYDRIWKQMKTFLETEPFYLPALSNAAALLYEALPNINWAGFYLVDGDSLVLGPFQGKTACIRIARGKGVCGTAWEKDEIQLVPDVHAFPGHIACDSASRSEIVIPLHTKITGKIFGVLDIDSPLLGRFSEEDRDGLARFAALLGETVVLRGLNGGS